MPYHPPSPNYRKWALGHPKNESEPVAPSHYLSGDLAAEQRDIRIPEEDDTDTVAVGIDNRSNARVDRGNRSRDHLRSRDESEEAGGCIRRYGRGRGAAFPKEEREDTKDIPRAKEEADDDIAKEGAWHSFRRAFVSSTRDEDHRNSAKIERVPASSWPCSFL